MIIHPIDRYIQENLNMTRYKLNEKYKIPKSKIGMWVSREREINNLPIYFFEYLATEGQITIEEVLKTLREYEEAYKYEKSENDE